MFGNKSYTGSDAKKDDKKKEEKFKDFSDEDKADLKQSKPDSVIIHPAVKDLVEKIIRIRKKGA